MREFLNAILETIGAEPLTDDELLSMNPFVSDEGDFSRELYDKLKVVLTARESVSNTLDKLKAIFFANGLDIANVPAKQPASQIFVGAPLE